MEGGVLSASFPLVFLSRGRHAVSVANILFQAVALSGSFLQRIPAPVHGAPRRSRICGLSLVWLLLP